MNNHGKNSWGHFNEFDDQEIVDVAWWVIFLAGGMCGAVLTALAWVLTS